MWARFNHWQAPVDEIDQAIEAFLEFGREIKPRKREEPGYRGLYAFVDRTTGRGVTITLWDSEDDMRASEAKAEQQRNEGTARAGGQVGDVERYEIVDVDLV